MKDGTSPGPKKSLGQNFLVSKAVIDRIIGAVTEGDRRPVFEIGPGRGAVTIPLAKSGARIAAFEVDGLLAARLRESLQKYPEVEIVDADIRDVDFDLEGKKRGWEEYAVVGNIPYMLTSSILIMLPEARKCARAVIMIQKEVGERILASPGRRDCGILSVFMQAYFRVERVARVKAGSFRPRPKIDSVVLRFVPEAIEGAPEDRRRFLGFLKAGFSQRRKKLSNLLTGPQEIDKKDFTRELGTVTGVDLGCRAEELSLDGWFTLFRGYLELMERR
ncbi:MAG: ribosomal RNA small subunit methyltransferase A [Candidatus Krumholzibacteriota bacterium]|nr:ribosomal RNA small subunit methyltransferase A [Candidatus Krumholzibacteriota bacterium]